jgi:formylglycine-generating enzyme required for sulfatase activity
MEQAVPGESEPLWQDWARTGLAERQRPGNVAKLVERLVSAWRRSDMLIGLVHDEALLERPLENRPPFAYELAHPAAVSYSLVCREALGRDPLDAALDDLLCVHSPDWRAPSCWPDLTELMAYRDQAREAVVQAAPSCSADISPLHDALAHELQHHELLLTMLWRFEGPQKHFRGELRPPDFGQSAARRKLRVAAGVAPCGEQGAARAVDAFEIESTPVMNGEFFEFVSAGAYADQRWWTAAGWAWRKRVGQDHPRCWRRRGREWFWCGLFEEYPLTRVFDWPAIVGRGEAEAYLAWSGKRLATEGEYCRAAFSNRDGGLRRYPWGDVDPQPQHANLGLKRYSPMPVGSLASGASDWGVLELVGNGWEWTVEASDGGETPHEAVLLGASWATDATLVGRGHRRVVAGQGDSHFAKFRGVTRS